MPHPFYTSHRDDKHMGGEAPVRAHLALQTAALDGDPNALLPIPEGSHLFIIEDPRRADTIVELILEKVVFENHHLKEIRFAAYTKSTNSSRRLHLTAAWTGRHVSGLDEQTRQAEQHIDDTQKRDKP